MNHTKRLSTKLKVILLSGLLVLASTNNRAYSSANQASDQQQFSSQQVLADFEQLYRTLATAHANLYHNINKSDYDKAFRAAHKRLAKPMSKFEIQIEFQKFIALGKVAHARIDFPVQRYTEFRSGGGKALPIYAARQNQMWVIAENYSPHNFAPQTKLLAINGVAMESWFTRLKKHISADTDLLASSLLEFQLPQYLWLELGEVEEFSLTISNDGQSQEVRVEALSKQQLDAVIENRGSEQPQTPLREAKLISDQLGYLKPGPFYNAEKPESIWDPSDFHRFVDESFDTFFDQGISALIIDLRNNPGGDNSFSDHLISWFAEQPFKFASSFIVRSSEAASNSNQARLKQLDGDPSSVSVWLAEQYKNVPEGETFVFEIPESRPRSGRRFKGKVIALVDQHSYSNAVSVAAIIQDYGFGIVAGEQTADFATTYGSMETFTLNHTRLKVGFPKALIVRPSGDLTPGPLRPDMRLTSYSDASTQAKDSILEQLIEHLKQHSSLELD